MSEASNQPNAVPPTSSPQPNPTSASNNPLRRVSVRLTNNTNSTINPRIHVSPNGQLRVNVGRGGNVVNIPLPRHQNVVNTSSLPAVTATTTTVRTTAASHGSLNNMRLVPLRPQPIHDPTPNPTDSIESLNRFKCEICYEFMKDPAGCGKCSSRFCFSCLDRVMKDTNGNPERKCPVCRVKVMMTNDESSSTSIETAMIVRDDQLKQEIFMGTTVECRHQGCVEQIKLPLVSDHEKQCMHAMMKCRYSPYGCSWKGKRGHLGNHEANECKLAQVSELVDQFRHLKSDTTTRLEVLGQQTSGLMQMNAMLRENMQRQQIKSTSNLFALVEYSYLLTCCTPFLLVTMEKWSRFVKSCNGRASVTNFLVFLPTMLHCLSKASSGVENLFLLSMIEDEEERMLFFIDSMLGITIGILAVIMVVANHLDKESPKFFHRYSVPYLGRPQLIGDILCLSSFMVMISIFDGTKSSKKFAFLWSNLLLATTFFPSLVCTMSYLAQTTTNASQRMPTPSTMFFNSRAFKPLLFGLRASVLVSYFDYKSVLDAYVFLDLVPRTPKTELFIVNTSIFDGLSKISPIITYIGVKLSIVVGSYMDSSDLWKVLRMHITESLCAFLLASLTNYTINLSLQAGIKIAEKIIKQARNDIVPSGITKEYNLLGMLSFGMWAWMLIMIAKC